MAKTVRQESWLRVPAEEEAPEGVQALFDKADEKLGFVPNVLRVYAFGLATSSSGTRSTTS